MVNFTSAALKRTAFSLVLAAGIGSTLVATSASASTATSTILVSASVLSACLVTATPLAFGNYDPTASSATTGQTSVLVTCTYGTAYTVGLGVGTGSGATVATRKMTSAANGTLNYSLYSDSGRSTVWGTTIGTNTTAGTGSGLPQTYNVYGSIPAAQTAASGAYTDSITVTVTY